MEDALTLPDLPIRDWVWSFNESPAGIGSYKQDMKEVHQGMLIHIVAYRHSADIMGVYPIYDSLTVTKKNPNNRGATAIGLAVSIQS